MVSSPQSVASVINAILIDVNSGHGVITGRHVENMKRQVTYGDWEADVQPSISRIVIALYHSANPVGIRGVTFGSRSHR